MYKDDTTVDCIARAPYLASPVSIIITIIYYACIILIILKPLQANDPAVSDHVSISTFFFRLSIVFAAVKDDLK